ncbi:hypothetical protein BH20ACI1_BH20ACI1_31430 [soil metagenome]
MSYKFLFSICLIILFAWQGCAQVRNDNSLTQKNVRLDEKKPTTYLEFVKIEKRVETISFAPSSEAKPITKTEEYEGVLMRVVNNSRWAIQFRAGFDNPAPKLELKPLQDKRLVFIPLANAEVELVYGVEPINSEAPIPNKLTWKVPYTRIYGSVSSIFLLSGQSVVFVVKREEISRNLEIFVPFKYEWETSEKNAGYEEPEHRVYFTWAQFENAAGI